MSTTKNARLLYVAPIPKELCGFDVPAHFKVKWLDEQGRQCSAILPLSPEDVEHLRINLPDVATPSPEIGTAAVPCTGTTAVWCPVCGECKCTADQRLDSLDNQTCPLHSPVSKHGDPGPAPEPGKPAMCETCKGGRRRCCSCTREDLATSRATP